MNCPFRNFEDCPEHSKKGGCAFWLSYAANRQNVEAQVETQTISGPWPEKSARSARR